MKFLSEIVAITGEHFVTMKELVVINADMDKLNILLDCHKINAYRILYIAAVFDPLPDNKPHSDEYTTLQKTALGMFVNSRFKSVNEWVENNKDFDAVDSFLMKQHCKTIENFDFTILFNIYPSEIFIHLHEKYKHRYYPVPVIISNIPDYHQHDVYFRVSDISPVLPQCEQPPTPPATAQQKRKIGQDKAIRAGMEESIHAGILVGEWIEASAFSRGEVTKAKVQDFLYENGFKGDRVFQAVWKSIPGHQRSSGGRPPKQYVKP